MYNALRVRKNVRVFTFIFLIVCLPLLITGCYNVKDEIISAQEAVTIPGMPTVYMTYTITPVPGSNDYRFINTPGNNAPQESGYARAVHLKDKIYIVQVKYDNDDKYTVMFLNFIDGPGRKELRTVFPEVKVDPSRYNVRIETAGYFNTKLVGSRENIMAFLKAHAGANFNGEPAAVSAFKEKALAAESSDDIKPLTDLVKSATAFMQHSLAQSSAKVPAQAPKQAPVQSTPQITTQPPAPGPAISQNTKKTAPKVPPLAASNVPAAKEGDPREVLKQYIAEFATNDHYWPLREKIIKLVSNLHPKPAIPEEARRLMAQGVDEFKSAQDPAGVRAAADTFWNAMRAAPWWADVYFNLGLSQLECGYYKAAADSFKTYLLISPRGRDAGMIRERLSQAENGIQLRQQAMDKIREGNKFYDADDYLAAEQCYREAALLDPKYSYAHSAVAESLKMQKRFKEVIPELYEGIRLGDDKDLSKYVVLGWCLGEVENNRIGEIEVLLAGLQKDPNNKDIQGDGNPLIAAAYFNLGISYYRTKEYALAIQFMEQSIADGYKDTNRVNELIGYYKKCMTEGE